MSTEIKIELGNIACGMGGLLIILLGFVGLFAYGPTMSTVQLILYFILQCMTAVYGTKVFFDSIFCGMEES